MPGPSKSRWSTPLCALALAAACLVAPIASAGAWDPYEADAADRARRIAVFAFGAGDLARPGDAATIPTLTDLGMGELPYTAMALAFRVFGFHEWAGRLPLSLFALLGAMSLFLLVSRLHGARAAFFSVAALSTTPLYFLHARTMIGDLVAMAAFSMAMSGLALGVVETAPARRAPAFVLGALGLAAGFMSRGLLLGVAAPALAAGLATLVAWRPGRATWGLAGGYLLIGAASGVWFFRLATPLVGQDVPLSRLVGLTLHDPNPRDATFDRMIRHLGHALFPWSALVPIAIAQLTSASSREEATETAQRASFGKILLLSGAALSLAAHALVVPWAGALPFTGVAMIAGAIGVAASELELAPASVSRLRACIVAALALVLAIDLHREPARTLAPFIVDATEFPTTFTAQAEKWVLLAAGVATALAFFVLFDAASYRKLEPVASPKAELRAWFAERRAAVRDLGKAFYGAFGGNLVFAFVVAEAALVGLAAMLLIGSRAGWERIATLPSGAAKVGINAWWAVPLGILAGAAGFMLARDALRAIGRLTKLSAGALLVIGTGLSGAVLGLAYYPALGEQLSPRSVFRSYEATRADGEEIAVLGTSRQAGALYFDRPLRAFQDVNTASKWLGEEGAARRFLVLKQSDLPRLNSLWRSRFKTSIAVLDAQSSQNVLVSSQGKGPEGADPFGDFLFDEPPSVANRVTARFLDHIELIGWELLDERGRRVDTMETGKPYRARFVFKVLKRLTSSWQVFIHVDGHGKRHNADHDPVGGRYPMNLWQAGDILRDEAEITLEPNFLPGEYWVFFGFFQGEARLKVTDGSARDDRVVAGRINVR